jgi:hypothetical protein
MESECLDVSSVLQPTKSKRKQESERKSKDDKPKVFQQVRIGS